MTFCFICIFLFLFILINNFFRKDIKKVKPKVHPFGYRLIYTDQKIKHSNNVVVSKLLKSEKFGLQGKPDFLYRGFFGKIIPVELKSGKIGDSYFPHTGDMMQLAVYFIIVEEVYGKRPKYGNLIYNDYMFKIKNTKSIRKEVIKLVSEMKDMLETGVGNGNYDFIKCRHCLCKCVCEFYNRK